MKGELFQSILTTYTKMIGGDSYMKICNIKNKNIDYSTKIKDDHEWNIGWNKNNIGWWYCNDIKNKFYFRENWHLIEGEWYYFDYDGYAKHCEWVFEQGNWYYLKESCKMARNEWLWIDGECYYFYGSGKMACDTITPDGYKVDSSGAWIE